MSRTHERVETERLTRAEGLVGIELGGTARRKVSEDPVTILQANALSGIDVSEVNAAFIDTKRNPVLYVRPVVSANASIIKPVSQSFGAASFLNLHQTKGHRLAT